MAKRVDANQREIVAALRAIGCTVQDLHEVGRGCPDLLIGFKGVNYLAEVKSEHGMMTGDEEAWHWEWMGQVAVIRTIEEAIACLQQQRPD